MNAPNSYYTGDSCEWDVPTVYLNERYFEQMFTLKTEEVPLEYEKYKFWLIQYSIYMQGYANRRSF
jgi:hypothetical protein